MSESQLNIPDDADLLLQVIPPHIRQAIEARSHNRLLIEIVLDLGRPPEARFPDRMEELSAEHVMREDIDYVVTRAGTFTADNRAGIERTLHRISAIRNRVGTIIGLTCRIGRAIYGTVDIVRDVIERELSVLLLGRPGVGKTTLLREAARVLADDLGKRVIVVDTSNEIGGDGDIPHPGIGRARRMQVPSPDRQHAVMIEAVENHMPEVIVIDEIGTEAEAMAARTIAERGVQLIATAHGNALENMLQNPTLCDLMGGIQAVTLSDEEARRRHTQKTVLERKAAPTFDVLVEIQDKDRLAVHHDVAGIVDAFLRGMPLQPEVRVRGADGTVEIRQPEVPPAADFTATETASPSLQPLPAGMSQRRRTMRIFTYGVSRSRLERAIQKFGVPATVIADITRADVLLTLKSQEKRQPRRLREVRAHGVPLHIIKSNTMTQIENFLRSVFEIQEQPGGVDAALQEAEAAVRQVTTHRQPVELTPQTGRLRRVQHEFIEQYGLNTKSRGRDPFRRVVIYPL